ncbi:MAG: hypothetical protein LBR26_16100 [Prevotella sp.]|jgi:hypothetical protein|nr:hypothetical protein [Prevotella sp.]
MKTKQNKKTGTYVWSFNPEHFISGYYDSPEECINAARSEREKHTVVYIGSPQEPGINLSGLGDDIIDRITDELYQEVGGCADFFSPSSDSKAELNAEIEKTVKQWLEKQGGYSCFKVVDVLLCDIDTGKFLKPVN